MRRIYIEIAKVKNRKEMKILGGLLNAWNADHILRELKKEKRDLLCLGRESFRETLKKIVEKWILKQKNVARERNLESY